MSVRGWLDRLRRPEPPETDCGWCGDPFTPDNRADPEPFCTDHCQQYAQANPDYVPGAAGHDGVLHTPPAYAPEGDPHVPHLTCPDCAHTGPAMHSRDEAAHLAALHDQLIHRGRPTATAPDTPDPRAAGPGPAVEHGRTTNMPRSDDLDAMIAYAESNLPEEWTAYLDAEHPDRASAEQAMREDPASLWNQEAAAALGADVDADHFVQARLTDDGEDVPAPVGQHGAWHAEAVLVSELAPAIPADPDLDGPDGVDAAPSPNEDDRAWGGFEVPASHAGAAWRPPADAPSTPEGRHSQWHPEAVPAADLDSTWEREPDAYRYTPEQDTGRDRDVDALLSSALDRPRPTAVLEHDDDAAAGRDWRHHDHTAAVDVDRGDDLTR